jgi:hypothetical protein
MGATQYLQKLAQWFTAIGRELHNPAILAENIYNMNETGILLSVLTSRKVLLCRNDLRRSRGAGSKRTLVTAMEYISADGRCLNALIIWPTSTLRSDWTTHPITGWHFACSPSGYSNLGSVACLILKPSLGLMVDRES